MRILSPEEQKLAGLEPIKHPDQVPQYLTILSAPDAGCFDNEAPGFGQHQSFSLLQCLHADLLRHESRSHVEVGSAPHWRTESVTQEAFYSRVPTKLLLGAAQVKNLGFTPRPGFLYLAVPPPRDGWLSYWDRSHFKDLDDDSTDYPEACPDSGFAHRVLVTSDPEDERALIYRYEKLRKGSFFDVAMMINGRELVLPENEDPSKYVFHRTHIWEHQHGRAEIPHERSDRFKSDRKELWNVRWPKRPRFIETPFEFPMGYVRETIEALSQERRFQSDPFITSLEGILTSSFRPGKAEDMGQPFPYGEPDYLGPDLAWRDFDQPWWFQNLLLARLIGGPMWSNVLGNLDNWLEDPVRWDKDVALVQEERATVS